MTIGFKSRILRLFGAVMLSNGYGLSYAAPPKQPMPDAVFYLKPHPQPGQSLSDITYRVISFYGSNMDDSVVQIPAAGTYVFTAGDSADDIKWTASVRMDGKQVIPSVEGDYRESGTMHCYQGKCSLITDASGPFYNPTFWGSP